MDCHTSSCKLTGCGPTTTQTRKSRLNVQTYSECHTEQVKQGIVGRSVGSCRLIAQGLDELEEVSDKFCVVGHGYTSRSCHPDLWVSEISGEHLESVVHVDGACLLPFCEKIQRLVHLLKFYHHWPSIESLVTASKETRPRAVQTSRRK